VGQGLIFVIAFHVGVKKSEFIVVQPPGFSIIILEIFTISRHLLSMLVSIQKHKNWSKYDQSNAGLPLGFTHSAGHPDPVRMYWPKRHSN
jgi:hypothetical protein